MAAVSLTAFCKVLVYMCVNSFYHLSSMHIFLTTFITECQLVYIVLGIYDLAFIGFYFSFTIDFSERTICSHAQVVMQEIEPQHVISNYVVCATSKVSDQPAHMRSLIRAFASRLNII